jgi:hypothetical protein
MRTTTMRRRQRLPGPLMATMIKAPLPMVTMLMLPRRALRTEPSFQSAARNSSA